MTNLEQSICEKFNAHYGVFTGNGTTAMYLAFQALALQHKKVVFPAISCTNPVNAAIFAGYQVDFCDIQLSDYTIDVSLLEQMLSTGNYGIVVPTHIYGHRYNEKMVREICDKYNAILFEDAAQSFYIGNSDISVMSFGHTKACDTPLGGGIVFTNNEEIARKIEQERNGLPKVGTSMQALFNQYREQYYKIVKEENNWEERNKRLKKLQLESKKYFIFDSQYNPEIYAALLKLDKIVCERRKKSELFEKYLNDLYIIKPHVADMFRWRYTFLYKGDRELFLKKVRNKGIDISSWYYSLAGIYKNEHLQNADLVERQVINLWVDDTHSIERIKKEINILNIIMEETSYGNK